MKPLSERDENTKHWSSITNLISLVGMKPLSERDENDIVPFVGIPSLSDGRNEATL